MNQQFDTLVNIVKDVGSELGLTLKLTNVLSSTDNDTRQIASLVCSTAEEVMVGFPWRRMIGTDPWVVKSDGSLAKKITADNDMPLIDARVLKDGAKAAYLHAKGLTYNEEFRAYQLRKQFWAGEYNRFRTISLDEGDARL